MSIEESELERVFMFNGREITDPDPEMSAKEVMELLSKQYPSLTNGEIADKNVYQCDSSHRMFIIMAIVSIV